MMRLYSESKIYKINYNPIQVDSLIDYLVSGNLDPVKANIVLMYLYIVQVRTRKFIVCLDRSKFLNKFGGDIFTL